MLTSPQKNKMEKRCPAIFGVITLVLLCAGAFSPGWFVFDTAKLFEDKGLYTSDGIKVHMGLFYVVAVGKYFSKVASYRDFSGYGILKIDLLEYHVEIILGIVSSLISVILTFTYKKEGTNGVLVASIIMYIIAGISTSLAVGRWLNGVIFSTYTDIPMIVPYSLILSAFGAIFCGITMICVSCMNCQHNDARLVQGGQVYSGVAMTDYPQTQPYTEGPPPYEQPQVKKYQRIELP